MLPCSSKGAQVNDLFCLQNQQNTMALRLLNRVSIFTGTGKTFVALHKMLMLLVGASGGRDAVHVFFVAPHEGLCIYFANWLMRRLKRPDAWGYSAIRRLNSTAGIWVAHKVCLLSVLGLPSI